MPDDRDDPRARVLARWPYPEPFALEFVTEPRWRIWTRWGVLGSGPTEADAWADAAGRLG